jgi:hypothetical protein
MTSQTPAVVMDKYAQHISSLSALLFELNTDRGLITAVLVFQRLVYALCWVY